MRISYLVLALTTATAWAAAIPAASAQPFEFNRAAAIKYAQAALTEFGEKAPHRFEPTTLHREPVVLSGIDEENKKVVLVLFESPPGHYYAGLYVNKDGYLEVFSRGIALKDIKIVAATFRAQPFMPGELNSRRDS